MNDLVSISAAAKSIGIDKSVLSRYLGDYPELILDTKGRSKLVDADQVREHREQNLNLLMSANHKGGLAGADEADDPAPAVAARSQFGYKDAKTVSETAKAQMTRLDLADRLGQVLETGLVEVAIAEFGQMLVQTLEGRNRLLGDELATMNDPRAIAARLKESDREVLEKLSDALAHAIRPDDEAAAA